MKIEIITKKGVTPESLWKEIKELIDDDTIKTWSIVKIQKMMTF